MAIAGIRIADALALSAEYNSVQTMCTQCTEEHWMNNNHTDLESQLSQLGWLLLQVYCTLWNYWETTYKSFNKKVSSKIFLNIILWWKGRGLTWDKNCTHVLILNTLAGTNIHWWRVKKPATFILTVCD